MPNFGLNKSRPSTDPCNKIGHSLGGALAELDALYFTLNLPAGTAIKAMTYGTPRVGNPAFAQLIGSKARLKFQCLLSRILTPNARSLTLAA
jgi:predicted lipase